MTDYTSIAVVSSILVLFCGSCIILSIFRKISILPPLAYLILKPGGNELFIVFFLSENIESRHFLVDIFII